MNDMVDGDESESASSNGVIQWGISRLMAIDQDQLDRLFSVVLLVFMVVLIVLTFDFRREAQVFPRVIAIPVTLLLLLLLSIQLSQRMGKIAERYSDTSGLAEGMGQIEDAAVVETDLKVIRQNGVKMISWMILLFALILILGHVIGIPLFLLLIYRFYAQQPWIKTIMYSAITTAFIYLLFIVGLNARLYRGLLF